jgi:hypothetical protein
LSVFAPPISGTTQITAFFHAKVVCTEPTGAGSAEAKKTTVFVAEPVEVR